MNTIALRQVLLPIVLLAGSSFPVLAQEVRTTRTYDLRFLVWKELYWFPGHRSLPEESRDQLPLGGFGEEALPVVELAELCALLRDSVGIDGDDELRPDGSGLVTASCDAKKHDKIAAWVELCRQIYLEQVTFELHVLPNAALAAGRGTLTREETDALLRSVGPHPCFVTVGNVHSRTVVQTNQTAAYVRDYNVEVAQSSAILDPKVDLLVGGRGWSVGTRRSFGDKLAVFVSGQQAEPIGSAALQGIPTRDVRGKLQTAQLQLPRIRFDSGSAEALLADGEAMLFGVGDAESEVQCLRIRRPHAIPLPSGPDWSWVAIGDFVTGSRQPTVAHIRTHIPGDDSPLFSKPQDDPPPRVADEGQLMDRVRRVMRADDGLDRLVVYPRHLMSIHAATPERRAAALNELGELASSMVRQLTVEVRYGRLDVATASGIVDGRIDVGEAAGKLATTYVSPCLLHGWFGMSHGIQQAYVVDYEVEIAQDASVPDPVIRNQLTGTSMRGYVQAATRGHFRLALRVWFGELVGEIEAFDLKDERFGQVGLPRMRDIQIDVSPIVEANRWTLMHMAPLHGTNEHFAVVARVRG